MDSQSPPKRMTRARAAAKATEPATKTTKIVTAAAKAKATKCTATAPTSSSTNKRKIRPDDAEDEDPLDQEPVKAASAATMKAPRATRGRPKKTADEPAPESAVTEPAKPARGRPKKVVETTPTEPVRTVRATRAKKTKAEEEVEASAEPPKKATRGRPPASTATSKSTARATVKKTVKFEEPEKENIAPSSITAGKGSSKPSEPASGLRARPMRRPGVAGRTARGVRSTASASAKGEKPLPLSPKKVNQLTLNKPEDSDDELGMNDKPPVRPLMRHPIKPVGTGKKLQTVAPAVEAEKDVVLDPPETAHTLILGSPARRPPASPWKNAIRSPAKRVEGVLAVSREEKTDGQPSKSPFKASLLQSPAKRPPAGIRSLDLGSANGAQLNTSPMKMSLLSSPAKRILSPAKTLVPPAQDEFQLGRTPAPKPTLLATPLPAQANSTLGTADGQEEQDADLEHDDDDAVLDSPTRLRFPGRLSAVLPRHADPVLADSMSPLAEDAIEVEDYNREHISPGRETVESGEPMALDDEGQVDQVQSRSTTPPTSLNQNRGTFGLREKDLQPYNKDGFDSEDELSPQQEAYSRVFGAAPTTPCPATTSATPKSRIVNDQTRSSGRSTAKRVRRDDHFGFTPLAQQLNGWTAGPSPLKIGINTESPVAVSASPRGQLSNPAENRMSTAPEPSPMKNQFFEDEMLIRPDPMEDEVISSIDPEQAMDDNIDSPVLEDISFTEEDVALAAEAKEMSLMEPEQVEDLLNNHTPDDSISEASQEYGDENAIPIDPSLLPNEHGAQEPGVPPITPQRTIRREFHTVSKVPLKPAAEDSPRPKIKTRSHSISRLPVQRPTHSLTRNATVISYSPTKKRDVNPFVDAPAVEEERADSAPPVTPQKSEVSWSTMGTPARTPRRDIDPALLRGAVVFVDVHTSEGADASGIFVELLSQMGARCVKSWPWNPSSPPGKDGHSSKVGITHVVYKDGGKRTLEKVRESAGVVQCVGVSWVLDCERENQWLDEAPYYIDTSLVPRGGARRRKSMEPKALANLNGMLVPTPVRNSRSGAQTTPSTPAAGNGGGNRRRDSCLWVRTPEDNTHNSDENNFLYEDGNDDAEWDGCILTPVPKTPAPEAIARFAANISPATPTTSSMDSEDPLCAPSPGELMTRTCPPKASVYRDLGAGVLQREKDEGVLMRLMAARRKSLQFAPKIASPLSKTWH
ncbi:hypothetical protein B0H66DRAFT_634704 [Apodospora peruviana]|uniref:BRCT domain-containing protein n=1 Tax=Apodospora peruviana TaxID=516989 RepID=A0AAE0MEJ5_9PEZI|nr:hypothetical protein B0H66DRAFT_634704 [Apodospora peruviana]